MSGPPFSAADVAQLARIELNADELASLQHELNRILEFVGQIDALALDNVSPFFGIAPPGNTIRADQVVPGLSRDTALSNAPATADDCFVVPPMEWSVGQTPTDQPPTDSDS